MDHSFITLFPESSRSRSPNLANYTGFTFTTCQGTSSMWIPGRCTCEKLLLRISNVFLEISVVRQITDSCSFLRQEALPSNAEWHWKNSYSLSLASRHGDFKLWSPPLNRSLLVFLASLGPAIHHIKITSSRYKTELSFQIMGKQLLYYTISTFTCWFGSFEQTSKYLFTISGNTSCYSRVQ